MGSSEIPKTQRGSKIFKGESEIGGTGSNEGAETNIELLKVSKCLRSF